MRHFIAAFFLIISMFLAVTVFAKVIQQPEIGRFIVSYKDLNAQQSFCRNDATSRECEYAASRFCVANGFESGLGLVDTHGDKGEIVCTSSRASKILLTSFSELSAHHSACNTYQRVRSDVCQAAVKRYCVASGYAGGGYGPVNYSHTHAQVTCVNSAYTSPLGGQPYNDLLYTDLSKYDSDCDGPSKMSSTSCLRAADRICRRNGFAASQRITESSSKDAFVYCLKEAQQITTVIHDPRLENERFPTDDFGAFGRTANDLVTDGGKEVESDKKELSDQPDILEEYTELLGTGSLAQLPNHPDFFIARKPNINRNSWSLVLVRMDWQTKKTRRTDLPKKTTRVKTILQTPFEAVDPALGKIIVYTALDPSVIEHQGQYWIAFECQAFKGANTNVHPSTSTCMAAYTIEGGVDLSTFQILVSGKNYYPSPSSHHDVVSASVPTLFKHQGKPYLYWVVVNEERSNLAQAGVWQDLQTRGVELVWDQGRENFSIKSHAEDIFEANHPKSVVIADSTFQPDPNATWYSTKTADLTDVYSDGKHIYAAISVGENCLEPNSNNLGYVHDDNCYRAAIAKSDSPLKRHSFNEGQITILPDQSMGYVTFIERPGYTGIRFTPEETLIDDPFGETLLLTGYVNETYDIGSTQGQGIGRFLISLNAHVEAAPKTADLCDDKPLGWLPSNGICSPTCSVLGGETIPMSQTCDYKNDNQSRWYRAGEVMGSRDCCIKGN